MTREIRLYVEGGGDEMRARARFKTGIGLFLHELREAARSKGVRWEVIVCGGRSSAFDDYREALRSHPQAINFLLVDAEGPANSSRPWEHLLNRKEDQWHSPGVEDKHCHLMVQMMEAWFVADRDKLKEFYRQGFHENALPKAANVESVDKKGLVEGLSNATRRTQKGDYAKHKTRDAPKILEFIRPGEVRKRAHACKRLFTTLLAEINSA